MQQQYESTFLVIGGGIAGVSCIETLTFLCPDQKIILVTESKLIKTVTNLVPLAKAVSRFDIEERNAETLKGNLTVLVDRMVSVNSTTKTVVTEKGIEVKYKLMCLCTGARPKLIDQAADNPLVIGIRDTESVLEFQKRIKHSKRIAIVGNGGIASEIVYEIRNIAIHWVIKDSFISQSFVDPGAAELFQCKIRNKSNVQSETKTTFKRLRYDEDGQSDNKSGGALGPDWHRTLDLDGGEREMPDSVVVHKNCEVRSMSMENEQLAVTLTNGEKIICDFLVSATGVNPSLNFITDVPFELAGDGGILVDELMKTSIDGVYAAGDVCTAGWDKAKHWFQMRLWTQARQFGSMAGKSMAAALEGNEIYQDFCFELFGHVTQLFGYQVVLLGRFNGQDLGRNYEVLIRTTPDLEYIKYVLVDGKVVGAILIGETGLEETTENLILNELDVTPYGDDLLNPDIDIEDYFD
ncbi:pyridine nucleotide-disulfide oxidoreductase domain-containing protein 1 [Bradysia coprophila]|uniref:pyridine nucleotide-disulfide oxidoreductase domain-containing protein 1 n=1 Tax=Bradysia coprophila TaxID=38358 RepID=UPI00187DB338|nr:pyridine nucleotide-disulfide oxidoreductase domain-containing protein 1 [Bradysia coprophila]